MPGTERPDGVGSPVAPVTAAGDEVAAPSAGAQATEGPAQAGDAYSPPSDLIRRFIDIAGSRRAPSHLAAQALRAAASLTAKPNGPQSDGLEFILRCLESQDGTQLAVGLRLLTALDPAVLDAVVASPAFEALRNDFASPISDPMARRNGLRERVAETIRVPALDAHQPNSYSEEAARQIDLLVTGLTRDFEGSMFASAAWSLRAVMEGGNVDLAREFLAALARLERSQSARSIVALIHMAAAHGNMSDQRAWLIQSVARLIEFASAASNAGIRNGIVPLALAYVATASHHPQVDSNMAMLLGALVRPAAGTARNGQNQLLGAWDGGSGRRIASASDLPILAYHVLINLVHHWNNDIANTDAARILGRMSAMRFDVGGARIALACRALYEDMMRGTEVFDGRHLGQIMDALMDEDPQVQELIADARLPLSGQIDDFLEQHRKIVRSRAPRGPRTAGRRQRHVGSQVPAVRRGARIRSAGVPRAGRVAGRA